MSLQKRIYRPSQVVARRTRSPRPGTRPVRQDEARLARRCSSSFKTCVRTVSQGIVWTRPLAMSLDRLSSSAAQAAATSSAGSSRLENSSSATRARSWRGRRKTSESSSSVDTAQVYHPDPRSGCPPSRWSIGFRHVVVRGHSVTRRGLMNSLSRPALTSRSTEVAHGVRRRVLDDAIVVQGLLDTGSRNKRGAPQPLAGRTSLRQRGFVDVVVDRDRGPHGITTDTSHRNSAHAG